ncbi:MAG: GNAT family N-acetyltransferase [Phycisphaerales bacterium]|nr:MAG: GNAT family N-acetyltransferase [Phycisphaerales bacterium]
MKQSIFPIAALVLFTVILSGCAAGGTANPWSPAYAEPAPLATAQMKLVPLKPEHAQMDYDAFMSSREHLRETLRWGNWPSEDATVEANRTDLERHWREHQANEAYTYAVLSPDGSAYLGCVYLKPIPEDQMTDLPRPAVRVSYWVTESGLERNHDRQLVRSLHDWLNQAWGFRTIVMPLHRANDRGRIIAVENGFRPEPADTDAERLSYISQR